MFYVHIHIYIYICKNGFKQYIFETFLYKYCIKVCMLVYFIYLITPIFLKFINTTALTITKEFNKLTNIIKCNRAHSQMVEVLLYAKILM